MKPIFIFIAICVIALEAVVGEPANQGIDLRNKRAYDNWLEIIGHLASRGSAGGNSISAPSISAFPISFPIVDKDGRQSALPLLVLPYPVPVPVPDYSSKGSCSAGGHSFDVRFGGSKFGQGGNNIQQGEATSGYLIEVFKDQQPNDPELPPAVVGIPPVIVQPNVGMLSQLSPQQDSRRYLPDSTTLPYTPRNEPQLPKFDRSMVLTGYLTVNRADYTETYTAWYDAKTGSTRMEYHDGGTTCYRTMMSSNRVKRATMYTDRTGEQDSIVCGLTTPGRASAEDRQPPLPDTQGFTFAGYKEEFGGQVEMWQRDVRGGPGELGAAQGESLVIHHELTVHRRQDGFGVPLKYKVVIDSSMLGPRSDGYEHVYSQYREKEHNEDEFRFSERQCDVKETLDVNNKEHMARLEPIRDFIVMEARPAIYDEAFEKFKKDFGRTYADAQEEAMRKNLFIQSYRYCQSLNRQSLTFTVENNFLSDRLDEEIKNMLGVSFSPQSENNTLSYSVVEELEKLDTKKLPKEWDWREKGAVSSVKFQGVACSSCWAFAVTGSVEGALYIKTKKLVELSVQALVDCSRSHGAHGCDKIGTWPVHAYNYIKDRGLPAVGEYADYDAKDHTCKAPPSEPTTHIEDGVDITPNNIDALKRAIRYMAPSVVVVDALTTKSFINYKKGVHIDERCMKGPKKVMNHAVLAVGWGEHQGDLHFIIKNSWGEMWGDKGYIRLHAPSNTCGVLTVPSVARLQRRNIDKLPAGASASGYEDKRR